MNRSAKCGTGFFFKLQKYLHNEKLNEKIKQIKMIFVFFLGFDEAVIEHTVSKLTRKMNRKYKKKLLRSIWCPTENARFFSFTSSTRNGNHWFCIRICKWFKCNYADIQFLTSIRMQFTTMWSVHYYYCFFFETWYQCIIMFCIHSSWAMTMIEQCTKNRQFKFSCELSRKRF